VRKRHFRACVAEVLFLESDYIRSGFHASLSESDAVDALIDEEEVLEWLSIVAADE
jgi:hypothetical protein